MRDENDFGVVDEILLPDDDMLVDLVLCQA